MRDAEFGPIRLRAFGTYVIRVKDPAVLIRQIVGTDGHFTVEEIINQLRNFIVSRFAEVVGQSKIPVLDMAANYGELSNFLTEKIAPEFEGYGLELTKLLVENISLPPAVEEALDKRTSMGVVGNLAAYTQFNIANSIPDAAKNPGGLAAAGAGLGMGMAMAAPIGQALSGQQQAAAGCGRDPSSHTWSGRLLCRRRRAADRTLRHADACVAGSRRTPDPADTGVDSGHGAVDAGRPGPRPGRDLCRRAASASAQRLRTSDTRSRRTDCREAETIP